MASDTPSTENYGPATLGVCISTVIVAVLCVFLRLYIRIRMTHSFWWDDGFIVAAGVGRVSLLKSWTEGD